MKILLNRSIFNDKFISPLSRMTDKCSIIVGENNLEALCTTESKNPILYANMKCETRDYTGETTLNVPDLRRLSAAMRCIDNEMVELELSNGNSLVCTTDSMTFRYHLLEDGILAKEIVSRKKISEMKFDSGFGIRRDMLNRIISGMTFASDAQKLYISYKENAVGAALTDKDISNIDTISYTISDGYKGTAITAQIPISIDIIKLISASHKDCAVGINSKTNVLCFDINDSDISLRYIVSPLTR